MADVSCLYRRAICISSKSFENRSGDPGDDVVLTLRSTYEDRRWLDDCTRTSARSSPVVPMSRCVQRSTGLATQTNISVVPTPHFRSIDLGRAVSMRLCFEPATAYYCSISLSKRCILNHEPPVGAEQSHMLKY
jgi:hypothetical protein